MVQKFTTYATKVLD